MKFATSSSKEPQPRRALRPCVEVRGGHGHARSFATVAGLDAWVHAEPFRAERGGDVYSIAGTPDGSRSRIVLADVSGHGDDAAALARRLATLIRAQTAQWDCAHLADDLNVAFAQLAQDHQFATAIVATYSARTHQLSLCNAGHPNPLWFRSRSKTWQPICRPRNAQAPSNLPLGMLDDTHYEAVTVSLEPGDSILLYTDALTEARDAHGHDLGDAGLLRAVQPLREPAAVPGALLRAADTFSGGAPTDDRTVVVCHRRPLASVPAAMLSRRA